MNIMFNLGYPVRIPNQQTKCGICAEMNKKKKIVRKRPDRRIERTRQSLREALTSVVLEKGYESTTVQDILDRANIGRSTFYSHFHDKDELLVSGFEQFRQLVEDFDSRLQNARNPEGPAGKYPPTLSLFIHAQENHRLYKAMIGSEIVQRYLYKMITQIASRHIKHLAPAGKKSPVPQELIVHFLVSSFLAVLSWWIQHDMPCSPEEIFEIYHRLALPGINAGLGKVGR
jgi:AcrR family transcriptional regulator